MFGLKNRQIFENELNSEISLKTLKKLTDSERNDLIRQWLKKNRGDLRSWTRNISRQFHV